MLEECEIRLNLGHGKVIFIDEEEKKMIYR